MKTRYLLGFVLICDALMLFGGIPLERTTWDALAHHRQDRELLLTLLAANLALFGLCVCALLATAIAGSRGIVFAVRHFAKVFAQPR